MKQLFIVLSILIGFSTNVISQVENLKPSRVAPPEAFMTTIPFEEMEFIPATGKSDWKNGVVPNKTFIPPNRGKSTFEQKNSIPDEALQKNYNVPGYNPDVIGQNFEGISNNYGVAPPDTDGDVGINYYIQMVNNGFQIFNKSGSPLTAPADLSTIWQNLPGPWVGNYGDPIVLYDELADRWFLSQFSLPNYPSGPFYVLIAVSATSNPLGSYHLYVYSFTNMPDYPKFGVWPDAYYMSINQFTSGSGSWAGAGAAAFERSEMLNGNAADMVFFNFTSAADPWSFLPADFDGTSPPSGTPNYFAYIDYWSGTDRLRTYSFNVDWNVTSNSTFTGPSDIGVSSFDATANNVPQLGTSQTLDVLDDRLMYRLQYRNFGTYQTLVTNHTVNAGSGRAGIRWYELRRTTGSWSIYQQGTYAPSDGLYRWMASVAKNGNGDIALGFSVSSSGMNPAIRCAGRNAGDPLGQITISEETIHAGTASQTGVNRWGDYSAMSVDPADDNTFWYTQEYSSGGWIWRTRIASFQFYIPSLPPVANFSANSTNPALGQTVTFSDLSSNIPTSWSWTFNPNTITYVGGTSSTSQNPQVQFNALGQYTVSLTATNAYGSDGEIKTNYINVISCSYCSSSGATGTDEWIGNVTFNTINNSSSAGSGYTNYTAISTNVNKGTAYTFTMTVGSTGSWIEHCFVFIDMNQDCDFLDANESFDLGQRTGTGTLTSSITIPAGAATGATRMRVSLKYSANPTSCEAFGYGEVEDYTLNIQSTDLLVDLTAFLEGPYNGSTMTQGLAGLVPLNQPYNTSPWNYTGTESVGAIPANAIDWVLIELRNATTAGGATSGTRIGRKAAFIRNDGRVIGLTGTLVLNFGPLTVTNSLFVIVHHRNHISVLSATGLTQTGGIYTYNFSIGSGQAYGGTAAHKQIGSIWGMFGGNGDGNGVVNSLDEDPVWETESGGKDYLKSDYNFDTHSNNKDKDDIWSPNLGKGNQVPN